MTIIHADEASCAGEHLEFRKWLSAHGYDWTAEPSASQSDELTNQLWDQFSNSDGGKK